VTLKQCHGPGCENSYAGTDQAVASAYTPETSASGLSMKDGDRYAKSLDSFAGSWPAAETLDDAGTQECAQR